MPTDGPRHAAPRKPLLARLHMPAGKAVALAAMPSAVLMGMGLTPTLAAAKPAPKKLFDGACATAPDTAAESASPEAGKSADPSGKPSEKPGEKPSGEPSGKPSGKPSGGPSAAPSAGASAPARKQKEPEKPAAAEKPASPKPAASSGAPSPAPSPSPSASKATNPLDPLGLGDKLHDILTGGGKPAPPAASPAASGPASPAPAPKPSADPGKAPAGPAGKPSGKDGDKDGDKGSAAKTGDEGKDAPSAGPSTSPSPDPSGSTSPSAVPEAGDGELPPCPKGSVVDENEHHAFPGQPWYLEASKLTLTGLTYEGVKKITMVNGQKKDVLKFTADSLAIKDLHQIVNSRGKQYHVAGIGTESTITGGKVTMYTEELKGNLLGLIPATHSPSVPPPLIPGLKLPIPVFYTNVKIRQAGQFGGTLHIPNLHQYLTDGTYP
ncbi:PT domain-containing protein [Streptomyces sp. VNUA116]|uniref:PT domain-containing protein n=1 Tax=Streptomyces sp. VNUA116 TaxID=3062449 RepID=UPI0026760B57|nr:PT domain-containing protein [Streptomyces sp. VNUA116]WKU47105.1 PT domain-containing protein [Streptomyces sp. VNUA116]